MLLTANLYREAQDNVPMHRFSELKTYMDRVNEGHAKNFKYEELNPDFFIHAKNGALVHYLELLDKDLQLRA